MLHFLPIRTDFIMIRKLKKDKKQQKSSYLAGFYPNNARVFVALFLLFFLRMNAFKFHLQKASMQEASSKTSAFTAGQITETMSDITQFQNYPNTQKNSETEF